MTAGRPGAGRWRPAVGAALFACGVLAVSRPGLAGAQTSGYASVLFDVVPDVDAAPGRQTIPEARVRLFAERRQDAGSHLRLVLSGHVDGLLAGRGPLGDGSARAAIVRPLDLYAEFVSSHVEVRAGASRIVWGRLDEFQPTDVVNPIDLTRFLLEGRSEARLSVGLVRGRVFLPGSTTIEAIVVPAFRAGRFDQLDEPTAPFNLTRAPGVQVRRDEPSAGLGHAQGGARLTTTTGRVDWGVSAYRGYRTFPLLTLAQPIEPAQPGAPPVAGFVPGPPLLFESFPRFTMIGGDFETVRGQWGVRGELAAFVDDTLQSTRAARPVPGRSFEGGAGVDRKAGAYRVAVNALMSRRAPDTSDPAGAPFAGDEEVERTDFSLVGAIDRSFANETRTMRVFTVYDAVDRTVFARVIGAVTLRDNVWLEGSGGLFAGSSLDTLGRLTNRDFVYGRLKVYF